MLKPAKQPHIRLTALFLCVTMFLSTLFFNAHTAYAADGTIDYKACLLYTSPSPRDLSTSRMPSSA